MSKNLVIVESPAKAKTIEKYLGKDFKVYASYGHVRDLIPKSNAIDTENDFEMTYQLIERNEKHVNASDSDFFFCPMTATTSKQWLPLLQAWLFTARLRPIAN